MLESAPMARQLILLNGNVGTLNPSPPSATALVLNHDEIRYVGDDDTARRMREQDDEVLDLGGRLTLPGFTDSHIHFTGFAESLDNVNLEGCRSLEEALARVAARARQVPPGEVIHGGGWNHLDWQLPVLPTRQQLDAVALQHPVILTRKDGHSVWLNTLALARAGINQGTLPPAGGAIDRDRNGELTGIVRENAIRLLGGGIGDSEGIVSESALLRAVAHAHRAGLVGIHNIEGAAALRAWQQLHNRGKLTLRVVHSIPDTELEHARALGIERGFGDSRLRVQAIKIFADGSLGSQTAELREPFVGQPGNCGMAVTESRAMLERAGSAAEAGLDVWTHAIGDRAISRVLDVYAELRGRGLSEPIFRIEHAQHLHPDDAARFAQLDVIASMQPVHLPSDMRVADELLGPARARWTYAFATLERAGAVLAFGSDCPVERLDPLYGIHAAVTRENDRHEPDGGWYPDERLTVMRAVRAYTLGAARAGGDEARAGSLAPGKRPDVVVLDQDIFAIPARDISGVEVAYTICGGQVVWFK